MINPGTAIDSIVSALQNIPTLVTAIGGTQNVIGYHPAFPNSMYFQQALDQLSPGQILVRYLGTSPARFGENRIWQHKFGLYQKPPDTSAASSSAGHYGFLLDMVNGVPTNGNGSKMLNYPMVANCDLMDVPTFGIFTDPALKQDYFFVAFNFPEIGDQ